MAKSCRRGGWGGGGGGGGGGGKPSLQQGSRESLTDSSKKKGGGDSRGAEEGGGFGGDLNSLEMKLKRKSRGEWGGQQKNTTGEEGGGREMSVREGEIEWDRSPINMLFRFFLKRIGTHRQSGRKHGN